MNELVRIPYGRPGRFIKMTKGEAMAQGYLQEAKPKSKQEKKITPPENKQIKPEENKQAKADNFTEIPGVGEAGAEQLLHHGIHTFEQLKDIALPANLHWRTREAVEAWRNN
jgi:predicted flap endonuclease-1-like 5' DNA nuclease